MYIGVIVPLIIYVHVYWCNRGLDCICIYIDVIVPLNHICIYGVITLGLGINLNLMGIEWSHY